jgi:hypothetical protein
VLVVWYLWCGAGSSGDVGRVKVETGAAAAMTPKLPGGVQVVLAVAATVPSLAVAGGGAKNGYISSQPRFLSASCRLLLLAGFLPNSHGGGGEEEAAGAAVVHVVTRQL